MGSADLLGDARAVVLVEGVSDRIAVETAADRLGWDHGDAGIAVVATGGAHGMARTLRAWMEQHPHARFTGLYDLAEAGVVRRALTEAGIVVGQALEDAGFFACDRDLEDELLRALGPEGVERCLADQGDLAAFRKMQRQPEWRGQPAHDQLHRWIASGARRKLRYAEVLTSAAPIDRMPRPLVAVLERARQA